MEEKTPKHYVYIIECGDGSLYTGWTTDLNKRIQRHNHGTASKYTRSRLPVSLVHFEVFDNKSDALKREFAIKKMKRQEKLQLIR